MQIDLKPCPFCGAKLFVSKSMIANCETEDCFMGRTAFPIESPQFVRRWNRRAISLPEAQAIADFVRKWNGQTADANSFLIADAIEEAWGKNPAARLADQVTTLIERN